MNLVKAVVLKMWQIKIMRKAFLIALALFSLTIVTDVLNWSHWYHSGVAYRDTIVTDLTVTVRAKFIPSWLLGGYVQYSDYEEEFIVMADRTAKEWMDKNPNKKLIVAGDKSQLATDIIRGAKSGKRRTDITRVYNIQKKL